MVLHEMYRSIVVLDTKGAFPDADVKPIYDLENLHHIPEHILFNGPHIWCPEWHPLIVVLQPLHIRVFRRVCITKCHTFNPFILQVKEISGKFSTADDSKMQTMVQNILELQFKTAVKITGPACIRLKIRAGLVSFEEIVTYRMLFLWAVEETRTAAKVLILANLTAYIYLYTQCFCQKAVISCKYTCHPLSQTTAEVPHEYRGPYNHKNVNAVQVVQVLLRSRGSIA